MVNGQDARCVKAHSTRLKTAPTRLTEDENVDEINMTLLANDAMSDAEIFMTEAVGSAIIDTACAHTVCGEKWLDSYVNDLSEEHVNKDN